MSAVSLEMALEGASNAINAASSKRKVIAIEVERPATQPRVAISVEGGHFAQIRDTERNTATITLNDCLACSGCVTSAETILISQQSGSEFLSVMRSIQNKTSTYTTAVVSLSPQACESLAILFNVSHEVIVQKLTTFFRTLGVDIVLDTSVGIDIALLEAQREFVSRLVAKATTHNVTLPFSSTTAAPCSSSLSFTSTSSPRDESLVDGSSDKTLSFALSSLSSPVLPLLASECPGWVCFAEKTQGEKCLQYMSSVRSPQQIMGAIVKRRVAKEIGVSPQSIYHVSVMPCYDKKLEASRDDFFSPQDGSKDVDLVLATTELTDILLGNESALDESSRNVIVKQASNPHIESFFRDIGIITPTMTDEDGDESTKYFVDFTNSKLIQTAKCTVPEAQPTRPLFNGSSGSSNGYSEAIFRYTSHSVFGVHISPSFTLPWLAGSNPDLRSISLEYLGEGNYIEFLRNSSATNSGLTQQGIMDMLEGYSPSFQNTVLSGANVGLYAILGKDMAICVPGFAFVEAPVSTHPMFAMTSKYKIWRAKAPAIMNTVTSQKVSSVCMLWMGLAYGFRNIQNIVRQGLPSSPNYHYVEVMACPSGCLNGGGQIRASDIAALRESVIMLSKQFANDVLAQNVINVTDSPEAVGAVNDKLAFQSTKSSIFNAGSSLKAQKDLVQLLEKRNEALPTRSPWESKRMCDLYSLYFGGAVGSDDSISLFHTRFRAIENTLANVVPKW